MIGKPLGHAHVQTTARYAHLARDSMHESAVRVADSIAGDILQEVSGLDDAWTRRFFRDGSEGVEAIVIVQEAFILAYQRLVVGPDAKPCKFACAGKVIEILVAASVTAIVERRAVADALHDGLNEARNDSAGDRQQPDEADHFT